MMIFQSCFQTRFQSPPASPMLQPAGHPAECCAGWGCEADDDELADETRPPPDHAGARRRLRNTYLFGFLCQSVAGLLRAHALSTKPQPAAGFHLGRVSARA